MHLNHFTDFNNWLGITTEKFNISQLPTRKYLH